jgi:hypothetical protein
VNRPSRRLPTGDTVMTEGVFSGTHTGPFATPAGEIPPTGKVLELKFADVLVIRDGSSPSTTSTTTRSPFSLSSA